MSIKILFLICFFSCMQTTYGQVQTPSGLTAVGYDSHVELTWFKNAEPNLSGYRIYRAENGGDFEFRQFVGKTDDSAIDFIGQQVQTFQYKITAKNILGEESDFSDTIEASTFEMMEEELLTMVQEYTFRYFWDFAHPVSGMIRERNTTSIVTTGGTGFGIMAILVGIERGFISREDGIARVLKIVDFLEKAERFHGVWPHWMNGATGKVVPFSELDNGGDLVETAFLVEGLLTARECFSGDNAAEIAIRDKITQLWETVDWNWYRKTVQKVLYWHWSPNFGWQINHQIRGFNEAQIVYILAVASPTHPVPASVYHEGWAGNNYKNGNSYYDYPLEVGPTRGGPLFFAHYSYLGFDPRYKKDAYANYFNQNVHHTLINRQYCIENPRNHLGYSNVCWGLTASDDPFGYLAHEPTASRDNGTISPTAAISSMPYTPELSMEALKHFYRQQGDRLWGKYGFYDAFNLSRNWFASSYLAIDQGPIIGMIENYRTGLLWDCFMANREIQVALDAIGFEPDSSFVTSNSTIEIENSRLHLFPNPANEEIRLDIQFSQIPKEKVQLRVVDVKGRLVKEITIPSNNLSKSLKLQIATKDFNSGIYILHLTTSKGIITKKFLIMH